MKPNRLPLLVFGLLAIAANSYATTDAYLEWATAKWGIVTTGNSAARATTWGETADPDRDGQPNLLEYACETDPARHNPPSDLYQFTVPDSGALNSRFPQLLAWLRTDDPDLRITCQTSTNLFTWLPEAPVNFDQPVPANPHVWTQETGHHLRGLRQMHYIDVRSLADRTTAFMRLAVSRRGSTVTSPGVDPFSFTTQTGVASGSTARSNTIVVGGFAGTVTFNIPTGVTLYVNGIAKTDTTATVKAGDHLWMEATAPATVGVPRNYTLNIGGSSATWSFTTGIVAVVPDHAGTESGYTPVETGVSDTGAAQISIPIVVAPGTAGMQPKLSINYSSQGGNGPLGIGFSLGGLSAISRVGRTIAQDGVKGGVNFDANDRFALDGQRLIAINGADGADGTEYRLEFDPTSRIRSYGNLGGGPQSWIVETKSGLTMEFGVTIDSRFLPDGAPAALVWSLNKTTDSIDNAIEFVYLTDDEFHEVKYIRYTSNHSASLSYQHEVYFLYETRPDKTTNYVAGYAVQIQNRISLIESRTRNPSGSMGRVRRYDFAYEQGQPAGTSQMISVTEVIPDGSNLPPTIFEWQNNSQIASFAPPIDTGVKSWAATRLDDQAADFDGDGITDLFIFNTQRQKFDLFLNSGNGTFGAVIETDITGWNAEIGSFTRVALGDFNADGKMDVFSHNYSDNDYHLYIATGTGFTAPVDQGISPYGDSTTPIIPGDFDGDGRTDLLIWQLVTSVDPVAKYYLFRSTGTALARINTARIPSWHNTEVSQQMPGDYNGDGRTDILLWHEPFRNNRYNLFLATEFGFADAIETDIPSWDNALIPNVCGDFTGDGLTDVLVWHRPFLNTRYNLYKSTGIGFLPAVATPVIGDDQNNVLRQTSNDFTGDGIMDMVVWESANDRYWLNQANRSTFDNRVNTNIPSWTNPKAMNLVGDFNGDGRSDVCVWHAPSNNGHYNIFVSQGQQPALLSKAVSGHGLDATFTYKPLTDPSVHAKRSLAVYPSYELQTSMFVVSETSTRNSIDGDAFAVQSTPSWGRTRILYSYEGAWASIDGRGYHGFREISTTDETAGVMMRTVFDDSSPLLAGRVKQKIQQLIVPQTGGSTLISKADIVWNLSEIIYPNGNKTYFVGEGRAGENHYEVNEPSATALVRSISRRGPGPGGTMTYDAHGNLLVSVTATTAAGETFKETITNSYGDVISPTRWHLGRLVSSSVTKSSPNPSGGADLSATRSSSFSYHTTMGLLTQEVIEPNGGTLRQQKDYTHDAFGNILTSTISIATGEAPRTTTTTYTPDGRFVATTTNAVGHTESETYDPLLGNVLTQTGPNGLTTSWEYDAIGRPVKETRPDGTVTRSFYRRVTGSTVGAPPRAVHYVRVQSSGDGPKTVWYDLLDREIRADGVAFDGRTVSTHKVFNNRGEVTHASLPYFEGDTPLYSTMVYDAVGREIQQTDPGNRVTTTVYNGLTTTVTNPENQTVSTTVNAMGWTVQTTDAANKSMTRSYDPYGNLRFVTDPAGNTTELRYDVRGNKVWMSEPNSGVSTFAYNGFGELKTQTNAANQTVSLVYDRLGRVTTRTEPEGQTHFTYDTAVKGIGQLARESSGDFVRSYFYDHLSRPAATVESHGFQTFAVCRSYDAAGRPDTMTYPTGLATRQVYTVLGHLREVQNAATGQMYWRALIVNARGQISREVQGNGVVTDRAFEAETGLIDAITSTLGATGDVQQAEYDFDRIGNLTARRDRRFATAFHETFGYDALNRLKTVTTTGAGTVTAEYNDIGNIISRSDVGSFTYGSGASGPHALTGVTGGGFSKTCSNDAKGNRITDGATAIAYSSFNKPVRMTKGADTLRFDHGPDRAVFRQTTFLTLPSGATTQTVREYVGGLYERETTSEGLVRHIHYIAGGSGVTAIHTDERSASTANQRTRFIHKDHLGSVDVITDANGTVVERQSFDAWGRRRTVAYNAGTSSWSVSYPASPGSAETHRGFTGHEMLDLVGLVHMGGRIYDPITARFLSPDPFVQSPDNLQNLNRYSYVLNNPLSFTDPSGFFFKSIGKFFKKHWKTIAAVGVGVLTGGLGAWAAVGFTGTFGAALGSAVTFASSAVVFGAAAGYGFGSAFSGTLLAGGSLGDAFRAGLRAGAIGAATAYAGFQAGEYLTSASSYLARFRETTISVATGVVETSSGLITGNGKLHGFVSNVITAGMGGLGRYLEVGPGARLLMSAVVGGTVTELGGGKFSNGAVTAAFSHLLVQGITQGWGRSVESIENAMGGIWAAPNTAIGLLYGAMSMPFGGRPRFENFILRFENMPSSMMNGAMSLGDVNLFGVGDPDRSNALDVIHGGGVSVWREEASHTLQARLLGPFYLPAHGAAGAASMLTSPDSSRYGLLDSWHRHNRMEFGPMKGRRF